MTPSKPKGIRRLSDGAEPVAPAALIVVIILGIAGIAQAWSLALPKFLFFANDGNTVWYLQIAAQAAFVWVLLSKAGHSQPAKTMWRGFFQGWQWTAVFALSWIAATIWWLYISMHYVGHIPSLLAAAAVLLLSAFLAVFYILPILLWQTILRWLGFSAAMKGESHSQFTVPNTTRALFAAMAFACSWTLAEVLRGSLFTGFPWGAVGYAHTDGPLAVWAPVIGVYGIGWIAALLSALIGLVAFYTFCGVKVVKETKGSEGTKCIDCTKGSLLRVRFASMGLVSMGFVVGIVLLSILTPVATFTQPQGAFKVALLQGNIGQAEKFNPSQGVPMALDWYASQLKQEDAPLIITPETAIPMFAQDLPSGYFEELDRALKQNNRSAMVGIPTGAGAEFANSAILLGSAEQAGQWRYDKQHLVPFGEYIPPLFGWFVHAMGIPLADFKSGSPVQAPVRFAGNFLGVNICYEDLFGEELARSFVSAEFSAPTVLVNMSNIAWFGNTTALPQHLAISRMRALELERPMLRATNTGATTMIDHKGQVQALLRFETQGVLSGTVQGRQGLTPYARWAGRWGLWPVATFCVLGLGLLFLFKRRRGI